MTETTTFKQWPAEPTEEKFSEQAEALDEFLKAESKEDPTAKCKSATEFVDTFRNIGSGQMAAQMMLKANGFNALATLEGIQWLIGNR